ncbi:MAG: hypothetical protein JWP11_871 [Frankiales bacterium]|nr:hypothetical protein [Frankiales bacterium]
MATPRISDVTPRFTSLLLAAGPLLSLLLALPLLQAAARHDRHWRTTTNGVVDHRVGAGLFVLYGLAAATPTFATAAFGPRHRVGAAWMAACVLGLAVLCELVVSVAPEPWFTF